MYAPCTVVGVDLDVEVFDVLRAVHRIGGCARELIGIREGPAVGAHVRGYITNVYDLVSIYSNVWHDRRTDELLQALQLSDNQCTRSPS